MAAGIRPLYKKEFKYKVVNIMDLPSQNILIYLDKAIEFINRVVTNGGRVLVHCFAGVSRSASAVIAYMMATRKMTFTQAFEYVKRKRPIIFPNFGFQRQLAEYEKILNERHLKLKVKSSDKNEEEEKIMFGLNGKEPSSFTPYIRTNKLSMYEEKKNLSKVTMSPQKTHQVKPTQFHYPYVDRFMFIE